MNQDDRFTATPHQRGGEKKKGSCLMYGCLIALVVGLLLSVGGGFTGYWFVKRQVSNFTSTEPVELPVVEYSEEELAEIESRVEEFKETVESGEVPGALVLTADDINALIARKEDLKGKLFVTVQDGQISGDVSIPTDFLPGGKGRYVNASATFNVSLDGGVLIVTLADATVRGEKVPQKIIEALAKENLAKDAYKDPKAAEILRRFDSLTIEDDKIILTPRTVTDMGQDVDTDAAERDPQRLQL